MLALAVSMLDLDCDMPNLEILVKLVAHLLEKLVVGGRLRHDEVNGQHSFRGAHAPNMKIVQFRNARQSGEVRTHPIDLDSLRHCIKGESNRIAQQARRPADDDSADKQAYRRVEP
jgi:hypothetical protein